jgi:hypothetical protein
MSKTNTLPKIQSDIPAPTDRSRGNKYAELLRSMKKGDSVLVETKFGRNLRSTAWHQKIKVATRTVSKTEMRVWRIA